MLSTTLLVVLAAFVAIAITKAYDESGDVLARLSPSMRLQTPPSGLDHQIFTFTPDDEYPTGGYTSIGKTGHATGALTVLGFKSITHVMVEGGGGGYVPQWDRANGKLLVFEAGADAAALDEVGAGTDLSGEEFVLHIYGVRSYS